MKKETTINQRDRVLNVKPDKLSARQQYICDWIKSNGHFFIDDGSGIPKEVPSPYGLPRRPNHLYTPPPEEENKREAH